MTPFLAIDQGSSATKVLAVDGDGRIVGKGSTPVDSLSAETIILSVRSAVAEAIADIEPRRPFRIGISTQRSTIAFFDARGLPFGNVIPWWNKDGLSREAVSAKAAEVFTKATGLGCKTDKGSFDPLRRGLYPRNREGGEGIRAT